MRNSPAHFVSTLNCPLQPQTAVLSALSFLYRDVLKIPLPFIEEIDRAKASRRLPVVLRRWKYKPSWRIFWELSCWMGRFVVWRQYVFPSLKHSRARLKFEIDLEGTNSPSSFDTTAPMKTDTRKKGVVQQYLVGLWSLVSI
jgi:hypothetical protein